jgi:hypothetical protein
LQEELKRKREGNVVVLKRRVEVVRNLAELQGVHITVRNKFIMKDYSESDMKKVVKVT